MAPIQHLYYTLDKIDHIQIYHDFSLEIYILVSPAPKKVLFRKLLNISYYKRYYIRNISYGICMFGKLYALPIILKNGYYFGQFPKSGFLNVYKELASAILMTIVPITGLTF